MHISHWVFPKLLSAQSLHEGRVLSTGTTLLLLSSYCGVITPSTFYALGKAIPGHVLQEPGGMASFPIRTVPPCCCGHYVRHESKRPEHPAESLKG